MVRLKQIDTHTPLYLHTYARTHTHMQIPWLGRTHNVSISCRGQAGHTQSGHASHLGLLQSNRQQMDGQNDGQADGPPRWLILRDEEGGVKSDHSEENNQESQWAVLSPGIRIWSRRAYGCSLFRFLFGITPPVLQLYKSHPSLWKQSFTLTLRHSAWTCFCLQLPGYKQHPYCCSNISDNNNNPKGPGGRRAASPLHDLSLEKQSKSCPLHPPLHFYSQDFLCSFQSDALSFPYGSRYGIAVEINGKTAKTN